MEYKGKQGETMNAEILSKLIITNIRSAAAVFTPKDAKRRIENRENWAVIIKYEGETVYFCDGKKYLSNIENLVVLPRGCSYEWVCTNEGHFFSLEFECDAEYSTPLVFHTRNGSRILALCHELEKKRMMPDNTTALESIRDTYSIILALINTDQPRYAPKNKYKRIEPALKYISENYDKELSNELLSEIAGISCVYFRKLFSSIMGVSPMVYARELRINKAKEMLRSDYSSITDVASSLGYPDVYSFSRDFKCRVGVSPSKYK